MRRRVIRILVLLTCGVTVGWWVHRSTPDDKGPARAALDRVVPVVRFRQQPLELVLRECERVARVPIVVNWAALEQAAIRPDTPVTLHRYDGTLGDALDRIARQLPSGDHTLVVADAWDRIVFDRSDRVVRPIVVRVYDVADLLDGVPWLDESVDGPEVGCWVVGPAPALPVPEDPYLRRRGQLIPLITETVDPDSWRDNGGSVGDIRFAGDHLVVVQTVANQHVLAEVLELLRESDHSEYIWPGAWPEDEAWQALLARRAAGDIRLKGVPFDRALDHLRETFRVNIELDEDLPDDAELYLSPRVTLQLTTPTLEEVVLALGRCVGVDEPVGVASEGDGKGLILCTAEGAAWNTCTELYDLRPLLGENATLDAYEELVFQGMYREVAPDSWRDNGGNVGAVRQVYTGRAVVTQSRQNHRLLRQWLDTRLAESRGASGGSEASALDARAGVGAGGGR